MKRCIKAGIALTMIALVGCAGTKMPCSCAGYLLVSSRPGWTEGEHLVDGIYQTQGIGVCTGVQELDFKTADEAARQNLGRMIEVRVRNRIHSVQGEYVPGAGYSEGKISSWSDSEGILTRSRIFAHWVDPNTCTVYSGARIAVLEIAEARRKTDLQMMRRLSNQPFAAITSGPQQDLIAQRLVAFLSQAGVRHIVREPSAKTYVMAAKLTDIRFTDNDTVAHVELVIDITDPGGRVLWSRQQSGKAVSLKHVTQFALLSEAVADAFDRVLKDVREVLQHEIDE
jgi:hypothetical protein